jgi:CheY-like chemotaxis protein
MTKIAYLDDDQIQHLLVRKLIKIHLPNCTSEFFSEPESLEAWLNNNPVDLIISDINFGDSSGWDWVEIFSAKTAAPIVFVTASCLPEDRRKINEFSEVKGVFEKPISEADWRRLAELISELN